MKTVRYIQKELFCIFFIGLIIGFASPVFAQTSGDKLYSQGLELQKAQTVKSQQSAIKKFQSAKKVYDSAAKKKQCDDAISVSNSIIQRLKKPKPDPTPEPVPEPEKKVLELSNETLQLNYEQHNVRINVTTTESEWNITPITNSNGDSFVSVSQHPEASEFEIVCPSNNSTKQRSQTIEVRAGDLRKSLVVEQGGKPVILKVEKAVVEISYKGGSKSVEIYSNSDSTEEENNYRNWKVISKPEWVTVIGEEYKGKGFLDKLVTKKNDKNKPVSDEDASIVTSVMKVVVASKRKDADSRTGEIVISSDGQQAKIVVHQN